MTRLLATLLILSLASTFVLSSGTAQTETTDVDALGAPDYAFEPEEVTITVGTTVRWVNQGEFHTVTSTDSNELGERAPNGMFDEDLAEEGDMFNFTFEEPGTYEYYCKPHDTLNMIGTIIVTEADGGNGAGSGNETDDDGNGDDTNGSPGPGFALLLAGLAALVLVYRRR